MKPRRILIVEDEQALASALAIVSRRLRLEPTVCFSGQRAREELAHGTFAVVVLDIGLPDTSGLALLRDGIDARVLVITAHGNLENAVAAKQLGAAEYLVKPLDLPQLESTLAQLLASHPPPAARPGPAADEASALLIGGAPVMQPVFLAIANAAISDVPVLITGPTGTGKGLVARVIHANSARRAGPFITLQCAALPEQLLESELFGHEKNAFTGAITARDGHLERAAGGTLFLDEVADISLAVQAKLLRCVEERTFTRLGGREDRTVDLRLITATNRDVRAAVAAGRFREDLYYRLKVLEIELPPLLRRMEDLPALAAFFLGLRAPDHPRHLAAETLRLLQRYPWPGNVRELRNALEHALTVCATDVIQPRHLPPEIRLHQPGASALGSALDGALAPWLQERLARGATYDEIHQDLETRTLRELLRRFDNKPSVLARELAMNRATLLKKRQQMGL